MSAVGDPKDAIGWKWDWDQGMGHEGWGPSTGKED